MQLVQVSAAATNQRQEPNPIIPESPSQGVHTVECARQISTQATDIGPVCWIGSGMCCGCQLCVCSRRTLVYCWGLMQLEAWCSCSCYSCGGWLLFEPVWVASVAWCCSVRMQHISLLFLVYPATWLDCCMSLLGWQFSAVEPASPLGLCSMPLGGKF